MEVQVWTDTRNRNVSDLKVVVVGKVRQYILKVKSSCKHERESDQREWNCREARRHKLLPLLSCKLLGTQHLQGMQW